MYATWTFIIVSEADGWEIDNYDRDRIFYVYGIRDDVITLLRIFVSWEKSRRQQLHAIGSQERRRCYQIQ